MINSLCRHQRQPGTMVTAIQNWIKTAHLGNKFINRNIKCQNIITFVSHIFPSLYRPHIPKHVANLNYKLCSRSAYPQCASISTNKNIIHNFKIQREKMGRSKKSWCPILVNTAFQYDLHECNNSLRYWLPINGSFSPLSLSLYAVSYKNQSCTHRAHAIDRKYQNNKWQYPMAKKDTATE